MANTPYMIINNPVYVYDSDSSRSKIINALPIGTRIDTAYEKNGWLKLLTSGWILKTPDVRIYRIFSKIYRPKIDSG